MKNKLLVEPFLDGEVLYRKYFDMGAAASVSTLRRFAVSMGMKSKNGTEPTRMGVWKSMWRWASLLENREKAFQIFSKYLDEHGWTWDDDYNWNDTNREEVWNRFMLQKIQSAWQMSPARLQRFLKKNGWTNA